MKIVLRALWQLSALALLLLGALFAWINPHKVTLHVPLLDDPLALPLWSIVFVSLFIGFFLALVISQGEVLGLRFKIYRQKKNNA